MPAQGCPGCVTVHDVSRVLQTSGRTINPREKPEGVSVRALGTSGCCFVVLGLSDAPRASLRSAVGYQLILLGASQHLQVLK